MDQAMLLLVAHLVHTSAITGSQFKHVGLLSKLRGTVILVRLFVLPLENI